MVDVCHELARINEQVYISAKFRPNLGLEKVKQEAPAPQVISFHRTPQRKKTQTSHTVGFEITATPQV